MTTRFSYSCRACGNLLPTRTPDLLLLSDITKCRSRVYDTMIRVHKTIGEHQWEQARVVIGQAMYDLATLAKSLPADDSAAPVVPDEEDDIGGVTEWWENS